jgi:hypothetical protein
MAAGMAAIAALVFVVLHRVDGGEVAVNPTLVTSLRSTPGSLGGLAPSGANCIVGLTDGKFLAVIETCDTVRRLLER